MTDEITASEDDAIQFPPETAVFMRDEKGVVTVEWSSGRPSEVMCSTELIESWVDDRNAMVAEIARLKARLGG